MEVMLAKTWDGGPVRGWLLSEKLDGVRAVWDGAALWTRNGNRINAPVEFLNALPAGLALDGELWMGRGRFQAMLSVLKCKSADWSGVTFMVFDAPDVAGGFAARLAVAAAALADCAVARLVEHVVCTGERHFQSYSADRLAMGAEGVMLRRAGSRYTSGRSGDLRKHKPTMTDEAVVVGHETGKGRHAARIGSLVCEWRGLKFSLGSGLTDDQRDVPPSVGAIVTFTFQGVTDGGVPRNAAFLCERDYE